MSWIDDQIQYWLGGCYEWALLENWSNIRQLLSNGPFASMARSPLSSADATADAVSKKYLELGSYRFATNAAVIRDIVKSARLFDVRNYEYPVLMVDCIGPELPVIAYNRSIVHANVRAVLWPLESHINISKSGLDDTQPFFLKQNNLIFRGALSGPIESYAITASSMKVSRISILEKMRKFGDFFDVGLNAIPDEIKEAVRLAALEGVVENLLCKTLSFSEILQYKYVLCLEGADISSGFGGVLASTSVPVHTFPFNFEVWFFNGLQPWKHFVPIAQDGSNASEILTFCDKHPDLMYEISRNGREHMKKMLDIDYLNEIKYGVIEMWKLAR